MLDAVTWATRNTNWVVSRREKLSRTQFNELPIGPDKPHGSMSMFKRYRARINGRWHLTERQSSCGYAMSFASPIVIVLTAAELRECAA